MIVRVRELGCCHECCAIVFLDWCHTLLHAHRSLKKNWGVHLARTLQKLAISLSLRRLLLKYVCLHSWRIVEALHPCRHVYRNTAGMLCHVLHAVRVRVHLPTTKVYKARLVNSSTYVAVKVQRPTVLETVSKDLYVLRRAAEVYQGLMERFAPQQVRAASCVCVCVCMQQRVLLSHCCRSAHTLTPRVPTAATMVHLRIPAHRLRRSLE